MNADRRPVVIVDMAVAPRSPAGSCVLTEINALLPDREVTVVSAACEIAPHEHLAWLPVELPARPLVARFMLFQWRAWRGARRVRGRQLVQCTQGQFIGADVVYAHFCHRAYLRGAWLTSDAGGLRRVARWATHVFNAWFEARALQHCRIVVVPSRGLQRELAQTYPQLGARIRVIANPVDTPRFTRPPDFDRAAMRRGLDLRDDHLALAFLALGDFERKGLGLLLEATAALDEARRRVLRLVVIGGSRTEIARFAELARAAGLGDAVRFIGLQDDVRPYLWACDAFAFPSAYEIASLAILQAAAAGLPVLVSAGLYGAEEFVIDGVNGWFVERSADGVRAGLRRVVDDRAALVDRSRAAVDSVQRYRVDVFGAEWRALYRELDGR